MDPLGEKSVNWTPYRYGLNNPIRFGDYEGLTEEERIKAITTARSLLGKKYASALPSNDKVKLGQLDCSGFIRYAIMQNEKINDPFEGRDSNGVSRIMGSSRKVSLNKIREGDLVVMKSGNRENGHVGFITNVQHDDDGNVTQYTMLHSEAPWTNERLGISGGGDINEDVIKVGSDKGYARSKYEHRFFQWDNEEEGEENNAIKVTEVSVKDKQGILVGKSIKYTNTGRNMSLWEEFVNALLE